MENTLQDEIYYCPICNKPLKDVYNENIIAQCIYCGKKERADYLCPEGHYICEECRLSDIEKIIYKAALYWTFKNPLTIAELFMKHASVPKHGKEHHFIPAIALVMAAKNALNQRISKSLIKSIIVRGNIIPYGSCGFLGDCGATVSAGIAVSVLTHASYKSDTERALSMKATSMVLDALSKVKGPRCCKQSVYFSIKIGSMIIHDMLKIPIVIPKKVICSFYEVIDDCKKENCPFYPKT